jgi:rubrerythrin
MNNESCGSIKDIIEFAIAREEEAYLFYYDLSNSMRSSQMRDLLREFAAEERRHREKLAVLRDTGLSGAFSKGAAADLRISDYQVAVEPSQDLEYQHALMLAMQKEKAAFRLYTALAGKTDDPEVRAMMLTLANEEARHKLRLEIEYDENILTDN